MTGERRREILDLVRAFAAESLAPRAFVPGETAVPASGKLLAAEDLAALVDASLDGWLTTGRFNQAFEKRLARYLGRRGVLTANSGSSANLLAFSALTSPRLGERAIRKGDEVIGVAAGFPTTVNPILQFGAVPVFVDIELGTYNIDPALIEAAIGPRTKAIMLAHTLGNPFNLKVVRELCDRYGLWLIEDCCDALGSTYEGRLVGGFGDLGTLLKGAGGGALAAGALGLLLGNKSARKVGSKVITYGGLAALGVIAYKAYGNWQEQQRVANARPVAEPQTVDRLPAPQAELHSQAILKALVAAAKADGHVDAKERQLIEEQIGALANDPELLRWLDLEAEAATAGAGSPPPLQAAHDARAEPARHAH